MIGPPSGSATAHMPTPPGNQAPPRSCLWMCPDNGLHRLEWHLARLFATGREGTAPIYDAAPSPACRGKADLHAAGFGLLRRCRHAVPRAGLAAGGGFFRPAHGDPRRLLGRAALAYPACIGRADAALVELD